MLLIFCENYITASATNFSYHCNALLTELQDLGTLPELVYKTTIKDVTLPAIIWNILH